MSTETSRPARVLLYFLLAVLVVGPPALGFAIGSAFEQANPEYWYWSELGAVFGLGASGWSLLTIPGQSDSPSNFTGETDQ